MFDFKVNDLLQYNDCFARINVITKNYLICTRFQKTLKLALEDTSTNEILYKTTIEKENIKKVISEPIKETKEKKEEVKEK